MILVAISFLAGWLFNEAIPTASAQNVPERQFSLVNMLHTAPSTKADMHTVFFVNGFTGDVWTWEGRKGGWKHYAPPHKEEYTKR